MPTEAFHQDVLPSTPFLATNASLTHSLRFGWAIPSTSSLSAVSHLSISRIFPKFRLSALKRRTRRDVYTTRFFVNKGLLPLTHLTTKEYLIPHPSHNSLTRLCAWACHVPSPQVLEGPCTVYRDGRCHPPLHHSSLLFIIFSPFAPPSQLSQDLPQHHQ
jgi:hypothetical protein